MRPAALVLFLLALAALLSVRPLSAERAASPEMVAARQQEVKREFDELVKKLERMSLKLKEEDPSRADMCREALKRITASALDSLLDEMAALAREGRYGLALKRSEDVLKALQELLDVLEGAGDIDERLARLEGFITRLESLLERQKELRRRTEDEKELAPLAEPQGKLAIESRRLGSEMEDAAFPDSGSKVKLAADEMDGASAAALAGGLHEFLHALQHRLEPAEHPLLEPEGPLVRQSAAEPFGRLPRIRGGLLEQVAEDAVAVVFLHRSGHGAAVVGEFGLSRRRGGRLEQ